MAHNTIFSEVFASTGRTATWATSSVVASSASIIASNPSSSAGSPSGWGSFCCKMSIPASNNCYMRASLAPTSVFGLTYDLVVGALPTVGGFFTFGFGDDGNAANGLYAMLVRNTGGNLFTEVYVYHTGGAVLVDSRAFTLSTRRRLEVRWELATSAWAVRVDGIRATSGSISGSATGRSLRGVLLGNTSTTNAAATVYFNRIRVDTAEWIGYPDHPIIGTASGYIGHPGLIGSGTLVG